SKDLRTFGGTVRASTILADLGPPGGDREAKRNAVLATNLVAHDLGNTPAICRKAYIHPAVLEEYERAGRTVADTHARPKARRSSPAASRRATNGGRGNAPKRDRRKRERVPTVEQEGLYPEE